MAGRKKVLEKALDVEKKSGSPVVEAPEGWRDRGHRELVLEMLIDQAKELYGMQQGYIGKASDPGSRYPSSTMGTLMNNFGMTLKNFLPILDVPDPRESDSGRDDVERMIGLASTMEYPEGLYDTEVE